MLKMNKRISVLYICHDRVLMAGAVYSLINMIDATKDFVEPIVLVRRGLVKDSLIERGIECITFPFQLDLSREKSINNFVLRYFRLLCDDFINFLCILFVYFKLINRKIAVVHSNSSSVSIGCGIAKILKAKHVWHIREFLDLDFNTKPAKGWSYLKKQIYNSDYTIAITKAVYSHWQLENCSKSTVLYNAVRSIRDIEFNDEKQRYLLFCATSLSEGKGTGFAIELFCKSNLYKKGYRLKLIGRYTTEYKKYLDTISDRFGQTDFIDYLEYQKDIKPFMINAAAFLMCSANEAMGRVTVEAFFYGCPVLGHNTGGTKEIIEDGINGFLYNDMEDALEKLNLIVQRDISDKITSKAMENAKCFFSIESYRDKIKNIYYSVLG